MPELNEIVIPENILFYLEPIHGDSPIGKDASNEEEYFKLNMEIPKTTPDYKKCIELSQIILTEKSKDLKVAAWLCFALFRTDKIKGLKDGLNIISQLMKRYGNTLFPENIIHRSKALQFLNTTRFYKLVEREDINKTNASDIIEADTVLSEVISDSGKLFEGNVPVLKNFQEAIRAQVITAKSILAPPKQAEPAVIAEKTDPIKTETVVTPVGKVETQEPPKISVSQAQPLQTESKPSNEKEAIARIRTILSSFFEYNIDGVKKEKIPESYFIFGISRQLQWGRMIKPSEINKVTQIETPNQVIRGKMKEWFAGNNWDTLIPRMEINFIKADSEFPYWLDGQRFVVKALEQKGGNYIQAAADIKMQLAKLLNRIPDLPQLKFKDKQTSFADDETIKWINDEVKSSISMGKEASIILPPIMGEEYESFNKEYKDACEELPDKFEENLTLMQKEIEADIRRKGKFLRRLNLSNYCYQAKQYHLAKVNLTILKTLAEEYNLDKWEPALCTALMQSIYLTNKKLYPDLDDEVQKKQIEKEQDELFSRIAEYDGILALKLKQTKL